MKTNIKQLIHHEEGSLGGVQQSINAMSMTLIVILCVTISIYWASRKSKPPSSGGKEIPTVRGGILGVQHVIGLLSNHQTYLQQLRQQKHGGIYCLNIFTSRLVVVTSPTWAKSVLTDFRLPLSTGDMMMYFLRKVSCEKGAMQQHGISETQIHREVSALMGQRFTDHATTVIHAELDNGLLGYIEECIVCPSTSAKSEYGSNCLGLKPRYTLATEVYLFPLMRDLIGKIGLKTLMGREFVIKNPEFHRDLWDLDSTVFQLLLGLDIVPLSKYRSAREPRDRALRAVTEHHQALFDSLTDPQKAEQYGDLSDVSDIFKTRLKDWTSAGITIASCASANTALLWAANVNSAPVAFWLVWYIFQHGDLLEGIRGEIRDHIRYEQTENGNRLQIDVPALLNDCRLLNATYLETLRLEAHTFSFKLAKEDCIITEAPVSRTCSSQRRSYALRKGDFVCVDHGAHQTDELHFSNGQKFDPFRFLNGDKSTESNRSAYGDMYVFSGGKGECKGRSFARLEILLVASYLIHFWDIDPVKTDLGWDQLGRVATSGAHLPQKDIKVKMRRRFDGENGI